MAYVRNGGRFAAGVIASICFGWFAFYMCTAWTDWGDSFYPKLKARLPQFLQLNGKGADAILYLAIPLLLSATLAAGSNLRTSSFPTDADLDLEITLDNGERELFPLLPGTKCPTGHTCRVRAPAVAAPNTSPLANALKGNVGSRLAATMDWEMFSNDLVDTVKSDEYCTRRKAMARAAGMASGLAAATVAAPAFAAETKEVKMGADSGLLIFDPPKITICKGDSVKWINNKSGPHNVVFDEDGIPAGVDQEKISMDGQLGDEGDTFVMSFDTAGNYDYYCEPHRGAGMNALLVVA